MAYTLFTRGCQVKTVKREVGGRFYVRWNGQSVIGWNGSRELQVARSDYCRNLTRTYVADAIAEAMAMASAEIPRMANGRSSMMPIHKR